MPRLNIDPGYVLHYLKTNAGKKTIEEMRHELHLSATFLRTFAASQGIEISHRRIRTQDKADQIKELLDQGFNPSQIARKLKMYYNSVFYISKVYLGTQTGKRGWKSRSSEVENECVFFNPSERENWLI